MRIRITNGRILDASCGRDEIGDLWIEDGRIVKAPSSEQAADKEIDATGCFVMPGLVDLHVHLRDPGLTYKETVETGCAAAAKGGYTTIFAMPNTKPVADAGEIIRYVEEKGKKAGIHVHQVGAITKGMQGKELADLKGLKEAGCIAFSEDGKSVMDSGVYREAMRQAKELDVAIFAHCEDINLVQGGVMNLDEKAADLGLPGISNAVEDIIVSRDIFLAKETGARLHLCHCSTEDSVRMLRLAKEEGLPVSGEACPHHFCLTSGDIPADDGNYKMNPPLRGSMDRKAIVEGLREGVLNAISTDHAPHSEEEKNCSMKKAAFGIVGLETVVPLTITKLLREEKFPALRIAELLSTGPARIAGILGKEGAGTLEEGARADVTVINPEAEIVVKADAFASKGRNTPFDGWKLFGEVKYTICNGNIVSGE
ncbi:MAG: dihydroorotase [Lachnospiraceae bacterium]|jgi:dihydroorotase|nr:dihydroorotase [Lachnospiraceae bacterium]